MNMKWFRPGVLLLFLLGVMTGAGAVVLVADFSMNRMVELFHRRPFCKIHVDRNYIQYMVLNSDRRRMRQMSREAVSALEEACLTEAAGAELAAKSAGLVLNGVATAPGPGGSQGGLQFIYPGTKWCGPGNKANGWGDLGIYPEEDSCCREHDHCPNTLAPGECRRGLCNAGGITRAHCDCDARFRRCLQTLNTETANTLGAVFFNVVQVTCFKERRPCSQLQRPGQPSPDTGSEQVCEAGFFRSEEFAVLNSRSPGGGRSLAQILTDLGRVRAKARELWERLIQGIVPHSG